MATPYATKLGARPARPAPPQLDPNDPLGSLHNIAQEQQRRDAIKDWRRQRRAQAPPMGAGAPPASGGPGQGGANTNPPHVTKPPVRATPPASSAPPGGSTPPASSGPGPQSGAQQPFNGYTPDQMQAAGVMGMGRYSPNQQVNPGDLGPGTVTGPTQRLSGANGNTPAGSLTPPGGSSPNTPTGNSTGLAGMYGAAGEGADSGGGPAGGGDPNGPPATGGPSVSDAERRAAANVNITGMLNGPNGQAGGALGVPIQFQNGKPVFGQNDPRQAAWNALAPRLRAQVQAGKMSLGGALNRYSNFLGNMLPGQHGMGL